MKKSDDYPAARYHDHPLYVFLIVLSFIQHEHRNSSTTKRRRGNSIRYVWNHLTKISFIVLLNYFYITMDKPFFISLIAAIVLAYWGIWYAKKTKAKTSLSLLNENFISLLNTFQDNFKSLKIEFYELPINTNLFYYCASILNTGSIDIDKAKIYKPLELCLPNDCKIVECKIKRKSSDEINLKENHRDNNLLLEWDLLKPGESFSFELIVEASKAYTKTEFEKGIKPNHRITDLKQLDLIDAWNIKEINKKKF